MIDLEILKIEETCTGCGACANICPTSCIYMISNKEGFYYPSVNFDDCIDCKKCDKNCHVLIEDIDFVDKTITDFTPYMVWSNDDVLRNRSTSGGMFSILAKQTLSKNGVVFGARYNYEKERLEHNNTDNYDLGEFRKSKYIESDTLKTFSEVKSFLKQGREVLYCGTPCQIEGLTDFLGKKSNSPNLLLVDFICHGVPSNEHFTEYKNHIEKKKKGKIIALDFRPKDEKRGWFTSNIQLHFDNNKFLDELYPENLYYTAFQKDTFLRKACYTCNIVAKHKADITLGDFWGIRKYKPELNDEKGISLVNINNERGKVFFAQLSETSFMKEQLPLEAVEYVYKRDLEKFAISRVERDVISEKLVRDGYIKTVKSLYQKDIMIYRSKRILREVLTKVGIIKPLEKIFRK